MYKLSFHAPNADVAFFTRAQREILYVLRKEYLLFVKSEMFEVPVSLVSPTMSLMSHSIGKTTRVSLRTLNRKSNCVSVDFSYRSVNTSGSPLNPTKKKRGRKITVGQDPNSPDGRFD